MAKIGFDALKNKIEREEEAEGKSPAVAERMAGGAAYKRGAGKYGKAGMARKAHIGMLKAKKASGN